MGPNVTEPPHKVVVQGVFGYSLSSRREFAEQVLGGKTAETAEVTEFYIFCLLAFFLLFRSLIRVSTAGRMSNAGASG